MGRDPEWAGGGSFLAVPAEDGCIPRNGPTPAAVGIKPDRDQKSAAATAESLAEARPCIEGSFIVCGSVLKRADDEDDEDRGGWDDITDARRDIVSAWDPLTASREYRAACPIVGR